MRPTTPLVVLLLAASPVLVAPAATSEVAPAAHGQVTARSDAWEARVVALTNRARAAHDLPPLRAARCPDGFAEPWTRTLARRQVLEHQDLAPMLGCPNTSHAAENIAEGYDGARALVRGWMHSPGHRANILDPHLHRIGVAGWRAADGTTYATQDFVG